MSTRVLLVTGSRALSDTPQAEEWARAELAKRITSAVGRVVAGDARGPDAWAHDVAFACEVEGEKWSLDGGVYRRTNWTWEHVTEWANDAPPPGKRGKRWPLRRNRAMVAGFAEYARESKASVVALVAGWATTRGTQHTYLLARQHSLTVEVLVCPEAYGPRGGR